LEEAGDKDAVQSLSEDRKASSKKDKGAASLRLLPEKSNLELHDAVRILFLKKIILRP